MQPRPLIYVRDLEASSRWYQFLFDCGGGQSGSDHALLTGDGQVILELRACGPDDRFSADQSLRSNRNGLALWFETEEFHATLYRARSLEAVFLEEPNLNLQSSQLEFRIRDLDGQVLVFTGQASTVGKTA